MNNSPRLDLFQSVLSINKIINSSFEFFQRSGPAGSTSSAGSDSRYVADRFFIGQEGTTIVSEVSRVANTIPTNDSKYAQRINIDALDTMSVAGDILSIEQKIEGNFCFDLKNKTAIWKSKVRTNKIGTYTFGVNNGSNSSFTKTFEVTSADNWTDISINVPIDYFGDDGVNTGLSCYIILDCNANRKVASDNQWNVGAAFSRIASGSQVSFADTVNNYFELAECQFLDTEFGDVVPKFIRSGRNIKDELELCQRYFEKSYDLDTPVGDPVNTVGNVIGVSGNFDRWAHTVKFGTPKRGQPVCETYSTVSGTSNVIRDTSGGFDVSGIKPSVGTKGFVSQYGTTVSANFAFHWSADSEL